MEKLAVCRMCLAKNVPLRLVVKKYLQEMFELLTTRPFVTDDCQPELACLICCARLRNCYQFMQDCLLSDKFLQHMLNSDGLTPAKLEQLPCTRRFGKSIVVRLDCTDATEPFDDIKVKEEITEAEESSEESSEEDSIQNTEEQDAEPDANTDDPESVDGSEPDEFRATVKSEPSEEDDMESDIIQWSDTEVDTLNEPNSSHDIPQKILKVQPEPRGDKMSETQAPRRITQSGSEDTASNIKNNHDGGELQDFTKNASSSCSHKPLTSEKQKIPINVSTRTGDKQSKCDDSNLNLKSSLVNHIHTGDMSYKCDVCGKILKNKKSLERHNLLHTGVKPYVCKICNKCYSDKRYLDYHQRIHTGERPFKCDICDKTFLIKAHLELHHRIHTGTKPFKCHICNKCFRSTTNLKKHIRVHTGDKPYECTICNSKYSQKCHLDRHVRTHMDDRKYECNACSKKFVRRDHFMNHISIHTRDK